MGATETLLNTVTTQDLSEALQVAYLSTLENIIAEGKAERFAGWVEQLTPLLNSKHASVQAKAISVIARMDGPSVGETLMAYLKDTEKPRSPRVVAVRALVRDTQGAKELLALAIAGDVPEDVLFTLADALRNSSVDEIRTQAHTSFPAETSRDGKPLPSLKDLVSMNGDAAKGRTVFFDETTATCSRCHSSVPEGPSIGPHLGKIGEKLAKRSLVESILDPNAGISPEYQSWFIDTKDEEGLLGYIRSEDANTLELVDSAGVVVRIAVASITHREKSPISIMPSGLSAAMTVQELVDLTAFLQTLK